MPTQTLRTDKDAYVAENAPAANHGAENTLKVESKDGVAPADKRLLCSFNLSQLPSSAVRVTDAKLRLVPTAQAAGRTLRCNEVTGSWTEAGVTWNNQPAVGTDHGTQSSGNNPQEWTVTGSVQSKFPNGRPEFRVRDDAEGNALSQLQEYASRESAGTEPELVVTYEDQRKADLSSSVTPTQFSDAADLISTVTVRRTAARFQQFRRAALLGAGGGATSPTGIAYDAGRDAIWVADQAARKVRRYARTTLALEQEYDVPAGFQPVGCAYDGTFLWLSDDVSSPMTIRKFSVGASSLTQEASYEHDFRTVLAWDGSTIWSADTIGQVVTKHNLDATLSVAETFNGLPEVWGLAFPADGDAYTLENLNPASADFRIRRRRASDLALLQTFNYRGRDADRPFGLAFAPGPATGHAYNTEETAGDILVRPGIDLASTVRPGNIPATEDLSATVRPGNIPRSEDLDSLVRANVPGQATLPSEVRPQLSGSEGLASTVRPRETEVVVRGQLRGILATRVVVDEQDFLDISAEVGSSITHTSGGTARTLRRVVQLVDTRETEAFPREVTSERGKASTQDLLRRGDAVLFAQGADAFRPGDTVAWQGFTWVVVGVLGAEMVGDVKLYQEVGLRRLSVTVKGRLRGTSEAPA